MAVAVWVRAACLFFLRCGGIFMVFVKEGWSWISFFHMKCLGVLFKKKAQNNNKGLNGIAFSSFSQFGLHIRVWHCLSLHKQYPTISSTQSLWILVQEWKIPHKILESPQLLLILIVILQLQHPTISLSFELPCLLLLNLVLPKLLWLTPTFPTPNFFFFFFFFFFFLFLFLFLL